MCSGSGSSFETFLEHPTLLWLFGCSDFMLSAITLAGFVLALIPALLGVANTPMMFALWTLYHSVHAVGQRWYGFGWEIQLLETGFLGACRCAETACSWLL